MTPGGLQVEGLFTVELPGHDEAPTPSPVAVEPSRVGPDLRADQILERMERISFQGRSLGTALRVWQKVLTDSEPISRDTLGERP